MEIPVRKVLVAVVAAGLAFGGCTTASAAPTPDAFLAYLPSALAIRPGWSAPRLPNPVPDGCPSESPATVARPPARSLPWAA
ncbi:hypothetical protein [Mycobacterium persicum]|uniref:Uncharacterized protein n=1 Tax=Mycobacterium persicum TaxID=1487726 RepID=A0AB38V1W2_9MYCO|nr:hypothetical protein [Mycobacterium persicum]VAZ69858.1 hypothetical protein LAUMK15_00032 [Mycobacterium persicum]VAZ86590.1 hypothetical protein LAUMK42_05439 [Mycobacterium persicum]VBA30973.1 hypothetical protein LAUMK4_05302 [Mycobacterium persicum]